MAPCLGLIDSSPLTSLDLCYLIQQLRIWPVGRERVSSGELHDSLLSLKKQSLKSQKEPQEVWNLYF